MGRIPSNANRLYQVEHMCAASATANEVIDIHTLHLNWDMWQQTPSVPLFALKQYKAFLSLTMASHSIVSHVSMLRQLGSLSRRNTKQHK
jgi:hypothetical protein